MNRISIFFLIVVCCLACNPQRTSSPILNNFIKNSSASILPNFAYAGYGWGKYEIDRTRSKTILVSDFGAIADDGQDDTQAIQDAIDAAGKIKGGAVVSFPAGTFHVNMDSSKLDIIRINYSNIILRGAGSGKNGTVIFSGSQTTQAEDNSPWLSPFVFHTGLNLFGTDRFFSVHELDTYAKLTKDAKKGDSRLVLETTEGLKFGDYLMVSMRNTTDKGDLMNHMMHPLEYEEFQTSYSEAGINGDASFQYIVQLDRVIDEHTISIKQPLHNDILTQFRAKVSRVPMLAGIGIEGFHFECDYQGGYKHHLTREHDYGWGAICMHRVAHGWVSNVSMHNYVQNVHLVNSRNVTVNDITMTGLDGHYGVKMYSSSDNLVENIDVKAKYTHGPGLEGCCFGNVYRNIQLKHPSPVDFHGISDVGFCPPMYNLYENMKNLTAAAGGGAPQNIPHAGEYNVFWNLEMSGIKHGNFEHELFHSWIWRDTVRFAPIIHEDCHKQYLRSIVVGVYHPDFEVTIEQSKEDRSDNWIYVESLNKPVEIESLYDFQKGLK